jgi:hypothetical protein
LASSLQTLIQQLGSGGSTSTTAANLSSSFDKLVQGAGSSSALASAAGTSSGSSTASNQSSNAGLTNFLNNLLQTVQSNGGHSLSSVGATVDAKV